MKKSVAFILMVVLISLVSCKDNPFVKSYLRFWVKNNSGELIYTLRGYQYPDTTIPYKQEQLGGIGIGEIASYDFDAKSWSVLFDQFPRDTLSLFLFSADTVAKYGWAEVRANYRILKRYDLSEDYLRSQNFTITYP